MAIYQIEEVDKKIHYFFNGKLSIQISLYLISTSGFMVNFMLRTDINMALVDMVESNHSSKFTNTNLTNVVLKNMIKNAHITPMKESHTVEFHSFKPQPKGHKKYLWTMAQTNQLQSAFYASYLISSACTALFMNALGTTLTFGLGHLLPGVGSLLIPFIVSESYIPLLLMRTFQGMLLGMTWPAFFALVSRWVSEDRRTTFLTATIGTQLGVGLSYPIFGYLLRYFGWHSIFYFTGTTSIVWSVFWFLLVYDDPQQHPSISAEEAKAIARKTNHVAMKVTLSDIPWKKICTSPIIASVALANFGRIWVYSIFFLYGPSYLHNIMDVEVGQNGIYNGIPYVTSYFLSLPMAFVADNMIKKGVLSMTAVRVLFTAVAQVIPGIAVFVVIHTKSAMQFCILNTIAMTTHGASCGGASCTVVDIAPNYAGPIFAYIQSLFMVAHFVVPLFASAILTDMSNSSYWHILFLSSALVAVLTFLPYYKFATSEIQPWNEIKTRKPRWESIRSSKSDESNNNC